MLLPGITVEQMERGEVRSKLRNPILANLLKDIPGYMERIGSGIRFMLDNTKELGLPAPQFREMGEFIVTFPKASALLSSQAERKIQYEETLWEDDQLLQPDEFSPSRLDLRESRMGKAVEYVNKHDFITNKIYRQLTGVPDRTATRDLETLVERGRLKAKGNRAARCYTIA